MRSSENHLLPPGMEVEEYYNRGTLTRLTTHTVLHNMLEGMVLVTIVLFFFLGSARAALVTAINIPIALLIAFCRNEADRHPGEPHLPGRRRISASSSTPPSS